MFEGEFTHEGDACTFEVLLDRFGLREDPALAVIGEVVHDIDIKDGKYDRPETAGVESLLIGIARSTSDDEERVQSGGSLFTALYAAARGARSDEVPKAEDTPSTTSNLGRAQGEAPPSLPRQKRR
jgi:hypothetical protein